MKTHQQLNIALVGCDTSHSTHFTRLLNDSIDANQVPGARVTAAIADPYGSIAGSAEKALKNATLLSEQYGIPLYDSIDELPANIDGIFILGTDGARHLPQFVECVGRGVPIFIDKPFALSRQEAESIFRIADEKNVPVMSSSSLRYEDSFTDAAKACNGENIHGADFFGYIELLESAPGFFWYGTHLAEILFATMGPGLEQVSLVHQENSDIISGTWRDGRIGTIRGSRQPHYIYGGTLHTATKPVAFAVPEDASLSYARMLTVVIEFMKSGISPIDRQETLEIVRFLEMAEELRKKTLL